MMQRAAVTPEKILHLGGEQVADIRWKYVMEATSVLGTQSRFSIFPGQYLSLNSLPVSVLGMLSM